MTVNVSIFYQHLSVIRSKIYYSNIWYVLPDFSITFSKVYFAFEKNFQIQHKGGKFFHKAWQLICVNISSKSKRNSSNSVLQQDKASFLHKFNLTFSKTYFTFEKKSKHCTKLGGFLTNEILLIHQTSDINTNLLQECKGSPLFYLGPLGYLQKKKSKYSKRRYIFPQNTTVKMSACY